MMKLCRIQLSQLFWSRPVQQKDFIGIFLIFFFYLAVVERSSLGEGKDAQRLLPKAVVLLPSSEVPPPRDPNRVSVSPPQAPPVQVLQGPSAARARLGRVGLGHLP